MYVDNLLIGVGIVAIVIWIYVLAFFFGWFVVGPWLFS